MNLPPGPKIPMLLAAYHWLTRPYEFLHECQKKYGNIFIVPMIWGKTVYVSDLDVLKKIFNELADNFVTGEFNKFFSPYIGDHCVLRLDGQNHAILRGLILPCFHGNMMKSFAEVMFETTQDTIDKLPMGQEVTIFDEMKALSLTSVMEMILGRDITARVPGITEILKDFLELSPIYTFLPWTRIDLGSWSPWGRFVRRRAFVRKLLADEIIRRRQSSSQTHDMIDLFMQVRNEEGQALNDSQIIDQCIELLLTAYKTSSSALSWMFVSILSHPQVLEKLMEEYQQVIGDRPMTFDMLEKLNYLEAVIKENLRLHDVVSNSVRKAVNPVKLGQYEIPPGTVVALCNALVHHLPENYPEPYEFRPERFMTPNRQPSNQYDWIPFGGGRRLCLGMRFVLFEMKIFVAAILARTRMELIPGQDTRPAWINGAPMFKPASGGLVRILEKAPRQTSALNMELSSAGVGD